MVRMEKNTLQYLDRIEDLLERTLQPVKPRAEFVKNLHNQLAESSVQVVERTADRNIPYLLIPLASIVVSLLIVATNVRLILSIIGILGLAQQLRQQSNQKRFTSTPAT